MEISSDELTAASGLKMIRHSPALHRIAAGSASLLPWQAFSPLLVGEPGRRAIRLLQPIALLFYFMLIGCSQPSATSHRESGVLLLDNRGGFSHGGRLIALHPDGKYTDTTYTDVIGDHHTKRGNYTLNPKKTRLILSPEGGASQELFRVDYSGQQYWVREADREAITQSSESWLRQRSVRSVQ
jgi:hypothetical protein